MLSLGVVALAEIGDKTQLLALLLAAKFRKPLPVISGIFAATALNHLGAAVVGTWLTHAMGADVLRRVVGIGFIAMAGWTLIPDKPSGNVPVLNRFGIFITTVIAFFLVEMGDKTQIATVALAAAYRDWLAVVLGTTVGMMAANVPVVLLGEVAANRIPARLVRTIAATIFLVLGVVVLVQPMTRFG